MVKMSRWKRQARGRATVRTGTGPLPMPGGPRSRRAVPVVLALLIGPAAALAHAQGPAANVPISGAGEGARAGTGPSAASSANAPAMPTIPGAVPAPAAPSQGLTPAGAGAGASAAGPEEPPTPAERLIDEAARKVAGLRSVAAGVRETIDLLDQKLIVSGNYLKAPDNRVYLLLKVSGPPETDGSTLQVCDGETLWDYRSILQTQIYSKVSIKPILERFKSPVLDAKMKDEALTQMGLAGPETLLVGLRRTFRFNQKPEDATLDGKPVQIFRGTWKSRQGLTGLDGKPVAQLGLLPPYVPSDAALYLGKDDGWPYKLELLGKKPSILMDTRARGPDGRLIGSKSSIETVRPTRIVLEYTDVKLNAPINVNEFAFQAPPNASVEDNTEMIVQKLDEAIQMSERARGAATSKKDGDLLEQPIEVAPPPVGGGAGAGDAPAPR